MKVPHERLVLPLIGLTALVLPASIPAGFAQDAGDQLVRRAQRVQMERIEVAGPDGTVRIAILPNAERLTYEVTLGRATLVEPSPLRMLVDGMDLSAGVGLRGVERYEVDETYPWHGARSVAVHRGNGIRIELEHDLSFLNYTLELRAYGDGVAFRHVIPGDEGESRVPEELTSFILPAGATVWYHDLGNHYESPYERRDASEVGAGEWAGPPVTFRLSDGGGYGAITEANLAGFGGMALEADGRRGWIVGLGHRQPLNYPFALRFGREEGRRLARPAAVRGTIDTPWRVISAARDLNGLVNSDIVHNLSEPPDPRYFPDGVETEWIRPGRAVWRYLDGGENTLEGMKEFARLAGALGFEYNLIEGFWTRWSMEERRELAEYSRERGVGVWFWRHTRELRTPEARREFFAMCRDLGVVGAKLDFLDHEAKEVVDLYEELLRVAAEHRVLVNFHGANKPTGRQRTWPNELTREGVYGLEYGRTEAWARHNTILPFTRMLAGPADYTPIHFGDRRRETSWAHQIASAAILTSPLLVFAAHPQSILDNPAVEVIRSIPSVWDETVVLPISEIGEIAAFARRAGDRWFLAVMNGPEARTVRVPLAFLTADQTGALLVRDRMDDPAAVEIEESTLGRLDAVQINLRASGGFIGMFGE